MRIEQEYEAETRILDTGFDGECPSVSERQFEQCTCSISDSESYEVVHKDNKENVFDAFHECIDVVAECENYHGDEECHRQVLHRLFECLSEFWKILCAEHSKKKRNAKQDDDGLEYLPERDFKIR